MKKGMLLLMCMALGTVVFAQGYTYKDADFAATAERIAQNKIVAEFPDGFYSDDENKAESTYSDRRALLQAAQEQYAKNPKSFIATYNYGAALLSEYHFDDSVSLSEQNAIKGYKVIKEAIRLNPASAPSYALLDRALEYILFGNERLNAVSYKTDRYMYDYDALSIQVYDANREKTAERLQVFEKRVALNDKVTSGDYYEAALMCRVLNQDCKSEDYAVEADNLARQEQEALNEKLTQAEQQKQKRRIQNFFKKLAEELNGQWK
ncbi:MAG: hypothetical protein J6U96_03565 [Elusimicrobiaceae bacterium]|nr:hypothetical protein [Elusimicrobiaceae bacterium]